MLLRNVTLGLHSGELDCVLVRVNHSGETESAFVDAIPQDGDGTTGRRTLARRGRTAAAAAVAGDDELDDEKKKKNQKNQNRPAVEVLAVFECKRNPDDVARGFHSRQTTLAWLAGDEASVRPARVGEPAAPQRALPPRVPPHETRQVGSRRGGGDESPGGSKYGKAVVLTRDSFRGFRRTHRTAEGRGGFYLDGVWMVTRPRTMCGLDAKVSGSSLLLARLFGFVLLLSAFTRSLLVNVSGTR